MFHFRNPKTIDQHPIATLKALDASMAVIWFDTSGKIVNANDNFCKTLGYPLEEIIGKHHSIFVSKEEAAKKEYAAFWLDLARGQMKQRTFDRMRKDGARIYIEASYVPLYGNDGQVFGVVKFATDVTAQTTAARHMQSVIDAVDRSSAIIEFDINGTIVTANENFLCVMGYSLDEIVGKHHSIFVFDAERNDPSYTQFWKDLRSGEFQSSEFTRRAKDGREVQIQAVYNPILGLDGTPTGVIKFATDVTLERELANDQSGQLKAIDRSEGVIEFDANGKVLKANRNFLNAVGYELDEIVGKHHSMFVSPEERDAPEYAQFWEALRRGEFQAREFRRIAKDGHNVFIQASYNPIISRSGKVTKVVKFATDTTPQKSAIYEFKQAVSELNEGNLKIGLPNVMPGEMEDLRRDFNGAIQRLAELISQIGVGTSDMQAEVENIATASDDLGRRTERQATSLIETAAALTQMTATVNAAAERAKEAAKAVGLVRDRSTEGKTIVDKTVSAMSQIAESSAAISKITSVIDDIAFQTNLLALNAGVEAARAGEAGRGFAVVASEVRALAQRSSEAAREIAELISTSESQVKNGVDLVSQSGRSLIEIEKLVTHVTELVQALATSAQEQSIGINEVNGAVTELDQVTQHNAAMFEESTAAVKVLENQAKSLNRSAQQFRV